MKFIIIVTLLFCNRLLADIMIDVCDRGALGKEIVQRTQAKDCKQVSKKKMSAITYIHISEVQMDAFPAKALEGLDQLSELHLLRTKIKKISAEDFKNLPNLTELTLIGNQLQSLPSDLSKNIPKLKHLSLSHNSFTELPVEAIKGFSQLVSLSFGDNQISKIPANAFNGMNQLVSLDLSKNKISEIQADTFKELSSLKILSLDGNKIFDQKSTELAMKGLWVGSIGKQSITACFEGSRGSYYYQKHLSPIELVERAKLVSGSIVYGWYEADGVFRIDEIKNDIAQGQWLGTHKSQSLPFQLKKTEFKVSHLKEKRINENACQGDEYNKPIEKPPKIIYGPEKLVGKLKYREASINIGRPEDLVDGDSGFHMTSIEIVDKENRYALINKTLLTYLNHEELFECRRYTLTSLGFRSRTFGSVSLQGPILMLTLQNFSQCGNRAEYWDEVHSLDMETGSDFNLVSIFKGSKAGSESKELPSQLYKFVSSRIGKDGHMSLEELKDCYGDSFDYVLHLGNDGIYFEIPFKSNGSCGEGFSFTFEQLSPYLNDKGKALVAEIKKSNK